MIRTLNLNKFHGFSQNCDVDSFGRSVFYKRSESPNQWDIRLHSFISIQVFSKLLCALQDSSQFLDPIEFKALMQDLQQRLDFPKDEILLFLAEVQGVFFRETT